MRTRTIRPPVPTRAYVDNVGHIGYYPSISQARDAIKTMIARSGRADNKGHIETDDGRIMEIRPRKRRRPHERA